MTNRIQLDLWERSLFAAGLSLLIWAGCGRVPYLVFQSHPAWFVSTSPALQRTSKAEPFQMVGKLEVPRLKLSTWVLEGSTDDVLGLGAGHVVGTAAPGKTGNTVIAGHRDSIFRSLRDIRLKDRIVLEGGSKLRYQVSSIKVVSPEQVSVLRQDGPARLTLITCYPFSYIGSAPQRYVVTADLVQ